MNVIDLDFAAPQITNHNFVSISLVLFINKMCYPSAMIKKERENASII
jgi:hypothetical protein